MVPESVTWMGDSLRVLDQRALPDEAIFIDCRTVTRVADAIRSLAVRGAPAIGIAAAYGMVLGAREDRRNLESVVSELAATRPTAVNLFWALDRMRAAAAREAGEPDDIFLSRLLFEAEAIHHEDVTNNKKIGAHGASLLPERATVLTHCNAGALATGGHGTALGILRSARDAGKEILRVYADETRPLLQGARLTAWELAEDGFSVTVICDSMAAHLMSRERVDAVIVGADRIAANGDAANKIGTYGLAVLAAYHRVPFYVAAPRSSFDPGLAEGREIPIEERGAEEVRLLPDGKRVPDAVSVWNPAFDVTPAALITAIVDETGVYKAPYDFTRGGAGTWKSRSNTT